jgi:hypothetical protein
MPHAEGLVDGVFLGRLGSRCSPPLHYAARCSLGPSPFGLGLALRATAPYRWRGATKVRLKKQLIR